METNADGDRRFEIGGKNKFGRRLKANYEMGGNIYKILRGDRLFWWRLCTEGISLSRQKNRIQYVCIMPTSI